VTNPHHTYTCSEQTILHPLLLEMLMTIVKLQGLRSNKKTIILMGNGHVFIRYVLLVEVVSNIQQDCYHLLFIDYSLFQKIIKINFSWDDEAVM